MEWFTEQVIALISQIPAGKFVSYGQVAKACGKPFAARQVARILKTYSAKLNLPRHRVINSQYKISLAKGNGYEKQKYLLITEGIVFDENDKVNPEKYRWNIK